MLIARDAIMQHFRPILRDNDFTDQQWRVMRSLQSGPKGNFQLAEECFILPSSISRLVQGLVRRGLVVRVSSANENDLRRICFVLTEKGNKKIEEIAPAIQAAYKKIQSIIGKDSVNETLKNLEKIIETMTAKTDNKE